MKVSPNLRGLNKSHLFQIKAKWRAPYGISRGLGFASSGSPLYSILLRHLEIGKAGRERASPPLRVEARNFAHEVSRPALNQMVTS